MTAPQDPPNDAPNPGEAPQGAPGSGAGPDNVDELTRKARRLIDDARPHVEKLVEQARPEVEKAAGAAMRYWREHDDQIKATAAKLVRSRARGPLGFAFDAVVRQATPKAQEPPEPQATKTAREDLTRCQSCGAQNPPRSRFCNQCGGSLAPVGGSPQE
jgi:hypothetical protein